MTDNFPKVSLSYEKCGYKSCFDYHIHYLFDGVNEPQYITLGSSTNPVQLTTNETYLVTGPKTQFLVTGNEPGLDKAIYIVECMQKTQQERWKRRNYDFSNIIQLPSDNKKRTVLCCPENNYARMFCGFAGIARICVNTTVIIHDDILINNPSDRAVLSPFKIIEFEKTHKITEHGLIPLLFSQQDLSKRIELAEEQMKRADEAILLLRNTLVAKSAIFE